jgi:predicted ABC-type ATPase
MKPEFILVTGANGTGKTNLIETNRFSLESDGFKIIIPDNILELATSHTDISEVIKEYVDDALSQKVNFVLETPFQFESMKATLDRIRSAGYSMSMYQIFVKGVGESAIRVQKRYKEGGLFIDPEEVRNNFNANFKNVADQFGRFDHSFFIDNSTNKGMKLAAEFHKGILFRLNPTDNLYLRKLFQVSALLKRIDKVFLKIIKANKNYPGSLRKRRSGRRLKF